MNNMDHEFPAGVDGLPGSGALTSVALAHGDTFPLAVTAVANRIGTDTVRMLAYNGSVPGPTIVVQQGTELAVDITNHGDTETTVHWHGLRLDNQHDGTHETQRPIPVGGSHQARLLFPDPGIYWYHPHIRQDYGQEMGLYGAIVVEPADPRYWPPAHRTLVLTLDDVLIEDGRIAPFQRSAPNYVAMGRFGNVLLVNGRPDLSLTGNRGEVVRLFLVNAANARVFNVEMPGARMKLVGGDSGRVEREEMVDAVMLAPSERAVVDVRLERTGLIPLQHRTPQESHHLAAFMVGAEDVDVSTSDAFETLRHNEDFDAERARITSAAAAPPDRTLRFIAEMLVVPAGDGQFFSCPMHPHVTQPEPGHCPECGMALIPRDARPADGGAHENPDTTSHDMHRHAPEDIADGIEWEDGMVEVNRGTTPENMRWKIIDVDSGAVNGAIAWRFRVGDRVKIRLLNDLGGDHPMHHPFHVHGAGRFLVISRDEVPEPNLVWKDTVLVRAGETVDILLDVTNPGRWMAHCHIAEHHESGMMFSFDVVA